MPVKELSLTNAGAINLEISDYLYNSYIELYPLDIRHRAYQGYARICKDMPGEQLSLKIYSNVTLLNLNILTVHRHFCTSVLFVLLLRVYC